MQALTCKRLHPYFLPTGSASTVSVTIKEVAAGAGVSVATVSRVFNGSDKVREATRRRVLDAAQALGYVPNEAARSLITNRTHTIGVLLPDMHGEFFAQITRGLDHTARDHNYHLLVSSSHSDLDEARTIIRALHGRVDGLIVMWPRLNAERLADLAPKGLPMVLLSAAADLPFPVLNVDNFGGAYQMVEHLTRCGHERIAILTGPAVNYDAQERLRGYRQALSAAGLAHDASREIASDFLQATGYEATARFLEITPRPSALFASNDSMALGILRGLQEAGLAVPDDVAVVGFDDIPSAQYVRPALTTVRAPMNALGTQAMQSVLDAIDGSDTEPRVTTLATEVVVRASCGCSL